MGEESKKQNILIVHNYYQIPGGEDTVVANEKKMLEKHGHKVTLYSRNNAELKKMPRLRKIFLPITTVFNPRTYRDIKKLIKQENIEVVHVHNTLNLVSPAVYYAAKVLFLGMMILMYLCPDLIMKNYYNYTRIMQIINFIVLENRRIIIVVI